MDFELTLSIEELEFLQNKINKEKKFKEASSKTPSVSENEAQKETCADCEYNTHKPYLHPMCDTCKDWANYKQVD